jgi:DNA-binding transcriptional ArsR family regulator
MPNDLEPTWRALANPIRREMLDRLREGPLPTGELVLAFPDLSRFAVMQHLGVLEEGGLVVTHKFGRVRMNCLNVVPLRQISERWMSHYEALWADELIDLKRRLETDPERERRAEQPGTAGLSPRRTTPKPRRTRSVDHARSTPTRKPAPKTGHPRHA